jgi:hypothetical protein
MLMPGPAIRYYDPASGGFKELTGKPTPEMWANMPKPDRWAYKQREAAEKQREADERRAAEKEASRRKHIAYLNDDMQRREREKEKRAEQRKAMKETHGDVQPGSAGFA